MLNRAATAPVCCEDIRVTVVHRNLFAGLDVSQREEHHLIARHDAHEGVRTTRVIDEGSRIPADGGVDGKSFRQGNNLHHSGCCLLTQPRGDLPLTFDEFTGISGDLLAFVDWCEREATVVVDLT